MGRMSELHAAAPDALGLAIAALTREADGLADAAGEAPEALAMVMREGVTQRHEAVETLTLLWQALELPGVPDVMGGKTLT